MDLTAHTAAAHAALEAAKTALDDATTALDLAAAAARKAADTAHAGRDWTAEFAAADREDLFRDRAGTMRYLRNLIPNLPTS